MLGPRSCVWPRSSLRIALIELRGLARPIPRRPRVGARAGLGSQAPSRTLHRVIRKAVAGDE